MWIAGALLLTGCSLVVSLDGLSTDSPSSGDGGVDASRDATAPPDGPADGGDAGSSGVVSSAYARTVLADGPSLYLRFGEGPGTTTLKSEVGSMSATYPSGVERGVPGALAGDPDTAIAFGGQIIELPPGLDCSGTSDCVFELWFKAERMPDAFGWIVDHQTWNPRQGWDLVLQSQHVISERWANDSTASAVFNQIDVTLGEWHHVVSVFDATGFRHYYDGEVRETQTARLAIPSSTSMWTVGGTACFSCSERHLFPGAIDELAVYEHSLSESRIKAHYAAAKGP